MGFSQAITNDIELRFNDEERPIPPVSSELFHQILQRLSGISWSLYYNRKFHADTRKAVSNDVVAFAMSIDQSIRAQGKSYSEGNDLLYAYIELLPSDVEYLQIVKNSIDEIRDIAPDNSIVGYQLTVLGAAITAKLGILRGERPESDGEHAEVLQALHHARTRLHGSIRIIEEDFVYHQKINSLHQATAKYRDDTFAEIQEKILKLDPTDAYFNVEIKEVNRDGDDSFEITRHVGFVDAVTHDYLATQKNTRIKQLAAQYPHLQEALEKYKIAVTLQSQLTDGTKHPRVRLFNYHKHLEANYKGLGKLRDTKTELFLKVVGFILSTIFPVIGNIASYSRFFISRGRRFADAARCKKTQDIDYAIRHNTTIR